MIVPRLKDEFIDRTKLCSRKELKQEAAKWIKELRIGDNTDFSGMKLEDIDEDFCIAWIKHFFDINEDSKEVTKDE